MKIRFLTVMFLICCLLLCTSCKNKNTTDESSATTQVASATDSSQNAEVEYVLSVSINPQVSLSCGKDGTVVDVSFDNADAKTAYENMKWVGKKQSDCLKEMITAAKQGGYLKDGGTITLQVMGCSDEQLKTDILTAAQATVTSAAKAENLNVTVQTADNGPTSTATDSATAINTSAATDSATATNTQAATDNATATNTPVATDSAKATNTPTANNTPVFSEKDLYGSYSGCVANGINVVDLYNLTISEDTLEFSFTECTPYDPSQDSQEDLQYAKDIDGVSYIGRLGDGNSLKLNKLTKDSLTVVCEDGSGLSVQKFKYDPVKHTLTFTQIDDITFNPRFLNVALTKK